MLNRKVHTQDCHFLDKSCYYGSLKLNIEA